jgi:hypothetical protein
MAGDQGIGQVEMEVGNTHDGAVSKGAQSLPESCPTGHAP